MEQIQLQRNKTMNKYYYTSDFGKISYQEHGSAQRAILCLHSNSSCKEAFDSVGKSEIFKSWRVITVDLPGHGESDNALPDSYVYTIPGMAKCINALIESLDCKVEALVGWSLGGHVALEVAAHNVRITKVALSGTPPCGPGTENMADAFIPSDHMNLTGKLVFTGPEAQLYAEHTIGKAVKTYPHLIDAVVRADGNCRARIIADWTQDSTAVDQAKFVRSWKGQLAIIQGEDDSFVSKTYLQDLDVRNLWQNQVQYLKGAGHAPMLDKPDMYNHCLLSFLSQ